MKWLGAGNVPVSSTNNTVLNNSHLQEHQQQLNENESSGDNVLRQVVQEEPIVNYVFDCASGESQEYGIQSTQIQSKVPQPRWPSSAEDCFLEQMQEKWKYFSAKMSQPPPQISEVPSVQYQLQPIIVKSGEGGTEQYVFGAPPGLHPYQQHMADLASSSMAHNSTHTIISTQQQQQQHAMDMHLRNGEIASSTKKLWGVEEGKEDGPKGILNLNDHHHQMWRDSTWSSNSESRRGAGFPVGNDSANILSPRSSEAGIGMKMVEYVLASTPNKMETLEPRMRGLVISDGETIKKEKDKPPSSPYDSVNSNKKEIENGNCSAVVQQNGIVVVQNGLDEDKYINRQASPSEEEINKNGMNAVSGNQVANAGSNNVVVIDSLHGLHQGQLLNHHHHGMTMPLHQQFQVQGGDPQQMDLNSYHASNAQQQQGAIDTQGNVMTPFDIQQLFRNHQAQQAAAAAAAAAANPAAAAAVAAQQLQLIQQQQQQQFHLQQQQQLAAAAAGLAAAASAPAATPVAAAAAAASFAPPGTAATTPYLINPQEPYVIAGFMGSGPTVVPQYYGVPWGMYPAGSIIQPAGAAGGQPGTTTNGTNTANQQRRPMSPSQADGTQYQVIPAFYDQNGSLVMTRNGGQLRLVSPASVIVNAQQGLQPQPQQAVGSAANNYSTNLTSLTSSLSSLGVSAAGMHDVNASLGLSSGNAGRRDSFDRNTSAFSPSMDYARPPKWPQYGALASQSPLGLASGSLTPPPTMGSASNLQLGLMSSAANNANRSLMNAAPGAETMSKFRASDYAMGGLAANGTMFNTAANPNASSSLFNKMGVRGSTSSLGGSSITLDSKPSGRSRLLEDFRNNRYPSLQLRDLTNHIVEFSQDQHGSRFIQQKLERASTPEKQLVFSEILAAAYSLMTDVFGNYVIQKFFEFGTPEQKSTLAQKVRGHVLPLALQMYGCRVIQKALESVGGEQQVEIVRELDGHVLKCVKDQNGNHVVQKCIECVDPHALQFIINAFQGQVLTLSTHPYGCRVIQRILEHCTPEQTAPILDEMHQHVEQLIQDQYGNYVIQHVLEHGKQEDKSKLICSVRGKVLTLSQHKFASNVVEKCVTHATRSERSMLIEEVCGFNDNALHVMMKDQYANYVVQKMLDVCESSQRKILMHKIRPHFASLRKYTYGKHIISKLEKYFMKSNQQSVPVSDLGPIGPPTNGVL
ncbi:pumilio homolog 2-like isoform X2 [Daktulosphaira vitifoliae]|uniref:pumilio homolog 2-like isoform X2 n=1 Tax=Daktulosphaira vitifoliae TaxID=58002 RepID=UPI0021AAC046|nr:pumilio homolog 2-like isoform X2 [Daktulosphaira vitifoliae]